MAQPTYPHDIQKNYVWWLERERIALAYVDSSKAVYPENFDGSGFRYSGSSDRIYSPHEVSQIRIHYFRKAVKLKNITDVPEIPEQFHRALVAQVVQCGYEKIPDALKVAQYWEAKFLRYVRDGLRYSQKDKVGGFKKILGHW